MLLGAPTGSGKTVSAELTMLRVFKNYPDKKVRAVIFPHSCHFF